MSSSRGVYFISNNCNLKQDFNLGGRLSQYNILLQSPFFFFFFIRTPTVMLLSISQVCHLLLLFIFDNWVYYHLPLECTSGNAMLIWKPQPMASKPARMGGGICLYNVGIRQGSSDFFSFSDDYKIFALWDSKPLLLNEPSQRIQTSLCSRDLRGKSSGAEDLRARRWVNLRRLYPRVPHSLPTESFHPFSSPARTSIPQLANPWPVLWFSSATCGWTWRRWRM